MFFCADICICICDCCGDSGVCWFSIPNRVEFLSPLCGLHGYARWARLFDKFNAHIQLVQSICTVHTTSEGRTLNKALMSWVVLEWQNENCIKTNDPKSVPQRRKPFKKLRNSVSLKDTLLANIFFYEFFHNKEKIYFSWRWLERVAANTTALNLVNETRLGNCSHFNIEVLKHFIFKSTFQRVDIANLEPELINTMFRS